MKMQHADLKLLTAQITMGTELFHNKSIGEMRTAIREIHEKCSLNIMRHLEDKFDIRAFARSLPRYFLSMNSTWIDELITCYEETDFRKFTAEQIHPYNLQELLDDALDKDCLKDDKFRNRFELRISEFYSLDEQGTPQLELSINWDPSLSMAVPQKVLEPYRRLFRLSFILHRVRYLLHRKRFVVSGFEPDRFEFAAIFLIIRFVNVYHTFVFCTVLGEVHKTFEQRLSEANSLEAMVAAQHDLLCTLCDRARLDMEKSVFADEILKLIAVFSSYALGELDLNETNVKSGPIICRLKKTLLQSSDYSTLRNLLFGCNFMSIGDNVEEFEPLWISLKHIPPVILQ